MSRRIFLLIVVFLLLTATAPAADDPFIGKWKLNPEKSTLTDEMKVEHVSGNKYGFDLGSGELETIAVDGTDQPGLFGTTLAVTAEGPNNWKVVRKKDGRMLVTGIWTLSADGNTLHDNFTANRPNGGTSRLDYVYKRTAGDSGFTGTWESISEKVNSVYEFEIQPYQDDGLTFINPAQKSTQNIKFDGKDYPATGPNMPADFMSSGRRVDERTLQLTDKLEGKVRDVQEIRLSPDGKTLMMTVQPVSRSKPNILVFDRE